MLTWSYSPYITLTFLAALLAGGIAVFAWSRRSIAGAYPLFVLMLAVGFWAFLYAFELANNQMDVMITLAQWEYVGTVLTPVCVFLFVELYTGRRETIPWAWVAALSIVPAITLILVFTNDIFHLIWQNVEMIEVGPLAHLKVTYGYGFYLNVVYSYLLLVLSAVFMFTFLWRSRALYRGQALLLVAGILMPWLGNLFWVLKWSPVDLTPIFFSISGVLLAWGTLRYGLLDIVPIARSAVVDAMSDVVVVLDTQRRIVDLNPTAERMMRCSIEQVLGMTLDAVLPDQAHIITQYRSTIEVYDEIVVTLDDDPRVFDLRISALYNRRQQLSGRLVVMRDITEHKHLENSLREQMNRFELLLAVARVTAEYPTLDATMQNTLEIAVSLTNATQGSIYLVNSENVITWSILALDKRPTIVSPTFLEELLEHGLLGWVLRERMPMLVEDAHTDPRWLTLPTQPYVAGSALGLPIKHGDLLLGVLVLVHADTQHFTQRDLEVMTAAVQQMALAIRNASSYEEQRRMADQQAVLFEVLQTLQHPRALPQMAPLIVSSIERLTGWDFVGLIEPEDTGAVFAFTAVAGHADLQPRCVLPVHQGIFGEAWRTGRSVYIPDVRRNMDILEQLQGAYSVLILPLKYDNRVEQLLYIASRDTQTFDGDARVLAESLLEVITLAMQSARLYAALQDNLQRTDGLYHISRSLVEQHELSEMLQRAIEGAVTTLQADQIMLFLLDLDAQCLQKTFLAGRSTEEAFVITYEALMAGLVGWTIRHQTPALSLKHTSDPRESPELMALRQAQQIGSMIVVPLILAETVYGTIVAVNRLDQRDFVQDDVRLLSSIAAQIAVAMRNVRLFEHIQEERQRLQALVQSTRDGVILIGMGLQVLVVNAAALYYLDMEGTPETWENRSLWDTLRPLRARAPQAAHDLLLELRRIRSGDDSPGMGEYKIGSHDLEWYNFPVIRVANPLGRLIILRDVTALRVADKMRDSLMHTMVHDLRNPLTGIMGSLKLLSKHVVATLPAQYQTLFDIAHSSTERMLELVNAILDISRLENGRMPLTLEPFSLSEIINQNLALQLPLADQKQVILRANLPHEEILVVGDKVLIGRVIQNLVGNALKFTPEAGCITLTTAIQAGKVRVALSDTGIGIPPDLQERLFQKFVTGNEDGRGSGLGLAFCRMVLEAHNEHIWVTSELGKGSTFTFTLPLVGR